MANSQGVVQKAMKEVNNYSGGKSGSKVTEKKGPANKGVLETNPTKSGGIFRPTKGN